MQGTNRLNTLTIRIFNHVNQIIFVHDLFSNRGLLIIIIKALYYIYIIIRKRYKL